MRWVRSSKKKPAIRGRFSAPRTENQLAPPLVDAKMPELFAPAMTVLLLPSNAKALICEPPLANGKVPPRVASVVRLMSGVHDAPPLVLFITWLRLASLA